MWQLILHSLQKSVEKKPLDVEEVAAAAEAKVAQPNIAKVDLFRCNLCQQQIACNYNLLTLTRMLAKE